MKKSLVAVAAIAMVIAMVGGAWAGTTTSGVVASATVLKVCSAQNNGTINFGTALDGVVNAGGVLSADATIVPPTIYCTPGATYAVTASGTNGGTDIGPGYRLSDGTNFIAYVLSYATPITGAGFGTSIGGTGLGHLALAPSIPAGALDNAPAGTYSDTVTLTIAY